MFLYFFKAISTVLRHRCHEFEFMLLNKRSNLKAEKQNIFFYLKDETFFYFI
jgi:hypothetical protein